MSLERSFASFSNSQVIALVHLTEIQTRTLSAYPLLGFLLSHSTCRLGCGLLLIQTLVAILPIHLYHFKNNFLTTFFTLKLKDDYDSFLRASRIVLLSCSYP